MSIVIVVLRLALGMILVMSSVPKLYNPRQFISSVEKYRILPEKLAFLYGAAVPFIELAIGLLLIVGHFVQLAAVAAILLLLSFTIAVAIVVHRRENLNCGCFGLLYKERVGPSTLLRDGVLIGLAVLIGLFGDDSLSVISNSVWLNVPQTLFLTFLTVAALTFSLGVPVISFWRARSAYRTQVRTRSLS